MKKPVIVAIGIGVMAVVSAGVLYLKEKHKKVAHGGGGAGAEGGGGVAPSDVMPTPSATPATAPSAAPAVAPSAAPPATPARPSPPTGQMINGQFVPATPVKS